MHKLWNLLGHAPKSLQGEVKADYDAIINADDIEKAKSACAAFMRKIGGYETMQTGVPSVQSVSLKALAVV